MINLSSCQLSEVEMRVLNYGLGSVPTIQYDSFQTCIDFYLLTRQLKLRCMFGDSEQNILTKCKPKSTFVPTINDTFLCTFEKLILQDITRPENQDMGVGKNLSKTEFDALMGLKKDTTIVIKEADKGGGFVVMDVDQYIYMVDRLLSNEEHYQKIAYDPTNHIMNIVKAMVNEALALGYLDNNTANFL